MNNEDILLWADGTWCYRHELADYSHMSDDYQTVAFGSELYLSIVEEMLA